MGDLPDYGAYHATLIVDPALPGKFLQGGEVAYIAVVEGDLEDRANREEHACQMLPYQLSEALPIPVLKEWAKILWETGNEQESIAQLMLR